MFILSKVTSWIYADLLGNGLFKVISITRNLSLTLEFRFFRNRENASRICQACQDDRDLQEDVAAFVRLLGDILNCIRTASTETNSKDSTTKLLRTTIHMGKIAAQATPSCSAVVSRDAQQVTSPSCPVAQTHARMCSGEIRRLVDQSQSHE